MSIERTPTPPLPPFLWEDGALENDGIHHSNVIIIPGISSSSHIVNRINSANQKARHSAASQNQNAPIDLTDRVQVQLQRSPVSVFEEATSSSSSSKTSFAMWIDFVDLLRFENIVDLERFFHALEDDQADELKGALRSNHDLFVQLHILDWRRICDQLLHQGKIKLFQAILENDHPSLEWKPLLLYSANQEGKTPLDIIADTGHTNSFRYVLNNTLLCKEISFSWVINSGNPEFFRVYIEHLVKRNNVRELTLNAVIQGPNADAMVAVLLEMQHANASIWYLDRDKQSPLFLGVKKLSLRIIKQLIEKCPSKCREKLWCKNKQGFTVLQSAVMHHPDPGPLIQLLSNKYPYHKNALWHFDIEHSPLHMLINSRHSCNLKYKMRLHSNHLDEGFKPLFGIERETDKTISALNALLDNCPAEKVYRLCGVVPQSQTNILHLAAASGNLSIVQFVLNLTEDARLSHLATPPLWSFDGIRSSVLHYAAFGGNPDVFDFLVNECPAYHNHLCQANKLGLEPLHYSLLSLDERSYPHVVSYYEELDNEQLYVHARRDKRGKKYSLLHFVAMSNSAVNVSLAHSEYLRPWFENYAKPWYAVDKTRDDTAGRNPFDIAVQYGNIHSLEALKNEWYCYYKTPPIIKEPIENAEVLRYLKIHHNQFRVTTWEAKHSDTMAKAFHRYRNPSLVQAYLATWTHANDPHVAILTYLEEIKGWPNAQDRFEVFKYFSEELWKYLLLNTHHFMRHVLQGRDLFQLHGLLAFSPAKYLKQAQHYYELSILNKIINSNNAERVRRLFLMCPDEKKKYLYCNRSVGLNNPLYQIIDNDIYAGYGEAINLLQCVIRHCPPKRQHLLWDFTVLKKCIKGDRYEEAVYLINECPATYLKDFLSLDDTYYYAKLDSPDWVNLLSLSWPENEPFLLDPYVGNQVLEDPIFTNKLTKEISEYNLIYDVATFRFQLGMFQILPFDKRHFALKILLRNPHYAKQVWQDKEIALDEFLESKECIKDMLDGASAVVFRDCPINILKKWIEKYPKRVSNALRRNNQCVKIFTENRIKKLLPLFSPSLIRFVYGHLYSKDLTREEKVRDGIVMAVNEEGVYEPTGATFEPIYGDILTVFETVFFERLQFINWSRDGDSDIPTITIKNFLRRITFDEIAAVIIEVNSRFNPNSICYLVSAVEYMVRYNLFSAQKCAIVVAMMSRDFFVHVIATYYNLGRHCSLLQLATVEQKQHYLKHVLTQNLCIYLTLGVRKKLDVIKQEAISNLQELSHLTCYKERDNMIILLRGAAVTLDKKYFIKKAKNTMNTLRNILLKYDSSIDLKNAVYIKVDELKMNLDEMAFDNDEVIDKINALQLTTEDPEAEKFLDPLFGEFMENPMIIPGMGELGPNEEPVRLDLSRLQEVEDSMGRKGYINPFNRQIFPEEDYVLDVDLKEKIDAYLKKKGLE